jgi:hypothetical protein
MAYATPRASPNSAPAARVSREPGTNATAATTYPSTNAAGPHGPSPSTARAKRGT